MRAHDQLAAAEPAHAPDDVAADAAADGGVDGEPRAHRHAASSASRSACASTPPTVNAGMGPIASQARRIEPTCGRFAGAEEAKIIAAAPAAATS